MKCPNCGEEIPEGSQFCPSCNELIDETIGDPIIDKSTSILESEPDGTHYYQFHTNLMRAYGLFLMEDAVESFFPGVTDYDYSEEDEEEGEEEDFEFPIFGPFQSIMEEAGIAQVFYECLNKCFEKRFEGQEDELIKIFEERKDILIIKTKLLMRKIIGIRHGASEDFLREQSIVALQIAMETYLRGILEEIIEVDPDVARSFFDNAKDLKPEQVVRAFLQKSTLAEEVVNEINASKLIEVYQDYLKVPLNDEMQISAFYRIILIRNVLIHQNGFMNERNAQFGKDKGLDIELDEDNHISLSDEIVQELFNLSLNMIDVVQQWYIENYDDEERCL